MSRCHTFFSLPSAPRCPSLLSEIPWPTVWCGILHGKGTRAFAGFANARDGKRPEKNICARAAGRKTDAGVFRRDSLEPSTTLCFALHAHNDSCWVRKYVSDLGIAVPRYHRRKSTSPGINTGSPNETKGNIGSTGHRVCRALANTPFQTPSGVHAGRASLTSLGP